MDLPPSPSLQDVLPDTARVVNGALSIGGCAVSDLAQSFGTPLYVYDDHTLRSAIAKMKAAFAPLHARQSYAAKACAVLGILALVNEEGLALDVVSEGEMEAAFRVGFTSSQIHLHGNCKSNRELHRALQANVHAIVVDNLDELHQVASLARSLQLDVSISIRLRLRLEADTHPHLQTSGYRSKFGVTPDDIEDVEAVLRTEPRLRLMGLHAHAGSQITDLAVYSRVAEDLITIAGNLNSNRFAIEELSVGGGWAVAYRPGDPFLSALQVASTLQPIFDGQQLTLAVEPGRALVARSAMAVYQVGSVQRAGGRRLVAVDGGIGDNPRPALYGARYHAVLPTRMDESTAGLANIVGRYCESGDILARDVALPPLARDDLICVPVAGAYQLSMASTYNLVPQPAAVLVRDGSARLLVKRATIDDLFRRDLL